MHIVMLIAMFACAVHADSTAFLRHPVNPILNSMGLDKFAVPIKAYDQFPKRQELDSRYHNMLSELESKVSEVQVLQLRARTELSQIRQLEAVGKQTLSDAALSVSKMHGFQAGPRVSLDNLVSLLEQAEVQQSTAKTQTSALKSQFLESTGDSTQLVQQMQRLLWCSSTEALEMQDLLAGFERVRMKAEYEISQESPLAASIKHPAPKAIPIAEPLKPGQYLLERLSRSGDGLFKMISIPGAALIGLFVASSSAMLAVFNFRSGVTTLDCQEPLLASYMRL